MNLVFLVLGGCATVTIVVLSLLFISSYFAYSTLEVSRTLACHFSSLFISSKTQTILSKNHIFVKYTVIVPIIVKFTLSFHKPTIRIIPPIVWRNVKIRTGVLWCFGTGIFLRSDQYFSPNTDFEPQFSRLFGFLNNVGLIINQKTSIDIGIRQYQPIQTLDQMAKTKNGKVANLVHIDQGFACFNHLSPFWLNTCAICFSKLINVG